MAVVIVQEFGTARLPHISTVRHCCCKSLIRPVLHGAEAVSIIATTRQCSSLFNVPISYTSLSCPSRPAASHQLLHSGLCLVQFFFASSENVAPRLRRHPTQQQAAHLPLDRLADLHDPPRRADVHALAQVEALLDEPGGARVPAPGEPLEVLELGRDGPRRLADDLEGLHDGLVVAVLEPDPQALPGHGRRAQGLGLVGGERGRVRRHGPAPRHEGEEAGALQAEEEGEVAGVPGRRRQAQARLGGVLEVGAQVCKVLERHFRRRGRGLLRIAVRCREGSAGGRRGVRPEWALSLRVCCDSGVCCRWELTGGSRGRRRYGANGVRGIFRLVW